jgi:GDP-D-mannose dehydratase
MNVVIGDTSQISYFFPDDFEKISSRNIPNFQKKINTAFICFAEQRTFNKSLTEKDFIDVNVNYTSSVVNKLVDKCDNIVLYGTSELWNNCDGPIDINTDINYKYSPYIKSKEILWDYLKENRLKNKWDNVNIIHAFNFNSSYRKEGFLFYKFFDSIINKTINEVGNINIERDIIHPKYLVNNSIICNSDRIVGSGKLTNIKEFVGQLFKHYGLEMSYFIKENNYKSNHEGNSFWLKTETVYDELLKDTIDELNLKII